MIKSHKIKLAPTPEQVTQLQQAADVALFVYNWGLAQWQARNKAGHHLPVIALKKEFNAIKRTQFPWVMTVTKTAAEGAFMDLRNAVADLTVEQQTKLAFKSHRQDHPSFYVSNDKFRINHNQIRVPKVGWVPMVEPFDPGHATKMGGKIMSARFQRENQNWWVSIAVNKSAKANIFNARY